MSKKILIAGGGVVGCMTAFSLIQRGYEVTIVDKGTLGGESTWAGGGIMFPLLPWKYKPAVNTLALAGARLYPELSAKLLSETGINPEYEVNGMLVLPDFDLDLALSWCQDNNLTAQLQPTNSQKLALWLPQVAQIRPPRLIKAIRAWLQNHGAHIVENTELMPLSSGAVIKTWQATDGSQFAADYYVVCSGSWSSKLLGTQANGLEIKPIRGQMLLYAQTELTLKHMIYQDGFYLIPRRDGHLLAGSTLEDVGYDKSTTQTARDELHAKAISVMPSLADVPVIKHWSGLRPGSLDNIPSIKQHDNIPNLFLNTGHFRYGATMAPASAEILADLIAQA